MANMIATVKSKFAKKLELCYSYILNKAKINCDTLNSDRNFIN